MAETDLNTHVTRPASPCTTELLTRLAYAATGIWRTNGAANRPHLRRVGIARTPTRAASALTSPPLPAGTMQRPLSKLGALTIAAEPSSLPCCGHQRVQTVRRRGRRLTATSTHAEPTDMPAQARPGWRGHGPRSGGLPPRARLCTERRRNISSPPATSTRVEAVPTPSPTRPCAARRRTHDSPPVEPRVRLRAISARPAHPTPFCNLLQRRWSSMRPIRRVAKGIRPPMRPAAMPVPAIRATGIRALPLPVPTPTWRSADASEESSARLPLLPISLPTRAAHPRWPAERVARHLVAAVTACHPTERAPRAVAP